MACKLISSNYDSEPKERTVARLSKSTSITVNDSSVSVASMAGEDYICLTDIAKGEDNSGALIENWLRNKNTVEFLGVWEGLNNPDFNSLEFEGIMERTGLNRFHLSVKRWVEETRAVGLISKSGRYGGTYAHKDIAFEFAAWISPVFKLYLIKEFQRLKEQETDSRNIEWDVKRLVSKANYHLHTDAIKNHIIPESSLPNDKQWLEYAGEADLLNMAVFGFTAKQWQIVNPTLHLQKQNIRDTASINQLAVLSNLESANAEMIKEQKPQADRFAKLSNMAKEQLAVMARSDPYRSMKRLSKRTYLDKDGS